MARGSRCQSGPGADLTDALIDTLDQSPEGWTRCICPSFLPLLTGLLPRGDHVRLRMCLMHLELRHTLGLRIKSINKPMICDLETLLRRTLPNRGYRAETKFAAGWIKRKVARRTLVV